MSDEIILRWQFHDECAAQPQQRAQPIGVLSALRRWAIRRLLRSECPGYAAQADQFPQAVPLLLVVLATSEPEAQEEILHQETDPQTGVVFQKLRRHSPPPAPRPQNLWCPL